MCEKSLPLTQALNIVVLRSVVDCAGGVVGGIVTVKVDKVSDEIAQGCTKVHDGEVDEDESGTVAEVLEEQVAEYDQHCANHGQDAGETHRGSEGNPVCPPNHSSLGVLIATQHSLFTPRHMECDLLGIN